MSHRTQITLTDEQYARLREASRRSGLSLAELVRRSVERCYGTSSAADVLYALAANCGSWVDRDFDGATYVEELRRGMSRRLAS